MERSFEYNTELNVYRNSSFWVGDRPEAEAGWEWRTGDPVELDIPQYTPPNPAKEMDAIFKAQAPEVRAAFYLQKAAVKLAMEEGDYEAAFLIIENTNAPGFEGLKDQLKGKIPREVPNERH